MSQNQKISVVIPVFNEEKSILPIYSKIVNELDAFDIEIIFINDGSTDNTRQNILNIIQSDSSVLMIDFNRNFGKAAGLSEAFKIAKGDIVVTIDGDLQDDPSEIKTLISKINLGWDLVSGWKKDRKDPIMKILASRLFKRKRVSTLMSSQTISRLGRKSSLCLCIILRKGSSDLVEPFT